MVKRTVAALVVLTAWLGSAGGARAQNLGLFKNASLDIFAMGGGSTLVNPQSFTEAGRLYHARFTPGYKYVIGASVPYGKLLSFEGSFTGGPNNLVLANEEIFPHTSGPPASQTYPIRVYNGSLSAVFHAPFSFRQLHPYAAAGVDYSRFSPTREAIAIATNYGFGSVSTAPYFTHNDKFGLNVGVGATRRLTKRLSLRIDLRDHVSSSPGFGLLGAGLSPLEGTTTVPIYPVKGRVNNIVYTAGFVYHLGK